MDPQLIEWMEMQNKVTSLLLEQVKIMQDQINEINDKIRIIKLTNWM